MDFNQVTTVGITYNPYLPKTDITINDVEISSISKLSKYKGEKLQMWIYKLIDLLIEEINDDEFELRFMGSHCDFEDLKKVCSNYERITLVHETCDEGIQTSIKMDENKNEMGNNFDFKNKIEQLTDLVNFMQDGPIKELRAKEIKQNYERAINSEFEIAVVATMSSGKSTLINAMLGTDIIPAKNQACTAKISKIRNVNNQSVFSVRAYDKSNQLLESHDVATEELLIRMNEDDNIHLTCVEGNLPNIQGDSMNLVLIDTPGPNNSQDKSHREKTMEVIKNDTYKPLVLYILNATQLGINDDNHLLTMIRDEMNSKDKQSKDRFIFVLNKIDEIDTEKESIEMIIHNARTYLESNGIMEPNIYPASSNIAKNIRKHLNGMELTRKELRDLQSDADYFIESEDLHLLKYTPLNEEQKERLTNDLERFKAMDSDKGYLLQALYHSGIPYIEEAINEYLNKYAITFKIQEAIDSFKRIIDKKNIEQKIVNDLECSIRQIQKNEKNIQGNQEFIKHEQRKIEQNTYQLNETKEKITQFSQELHEKGTQLKGAVDALEKVDEETNSLTKSVEEMNVELQLKEKEAKAIKVILERHNSSNFKKKVDTLTIDTYMESRLLRGKINENILAATRDLKNKNKVSKYEAESIITNLNYKIEMITLDIKTDLDRLVDQKIKATVMTLMDEYKKEISGLFEDNEDINLNSSSIQLIMASMPSGKELAKQYAYEEEVAVGTEIVRNYNKKWYKPWTWKQSSSYERTIYETREFVNISDLMNNYIKGLRENLENNLDNTISGIEAQIQDIKMDFNKKVDRFDAALKQESQKYEQLIADFKVKQKEKLKEEEKLNHYRQEQEELLAEKHKLITLTEQLKTDNSGLRKNERFLMDENKRLVREIQQREKRLQRLNVEYDKILKRNHEAQAQKEFLEKINRKLALITVSNQEISS